MPLPSQTRTPYSLTTLPDKEALVQAFVGTKLEELRTPALIIDRTLFQKVSQLPESSSYSTFSLD